MPYFVNEFGQVTPQDTGKIGGTSIPEDLLPEFIRRFIEVDKAVVNIGEQKISEKFDYDQFNRFVESMGSNKHIQFRMVFIFLFVYVKIFVAIDYYIDFHW